MKSARVTMADRSVALSALQAARGEVESRRSKLMKLRGTPGIRVRLTTITILKRGEQWGQSHDKLGKPYTGVG